MLADHSKENMIQCKLLIGRAWSSFNIGLHFHVHWAAGVNCTLCCWTGPCIHGFQIWLLQKFLHAMENVE